MNPNNSAIKNYFLSFAVIFLFALSCSNEPAQEMIFETDSIESLIAEALLLEQVSQEGMQPGLYPIGSIDDLREAINAAKRAIDQNESQEAINEAAQKLKKAIDIFKTLKYRVAVPYIKQKNGSYIQISDNIKYTTNASFTMETDCYFMDLNPLGYSNTIFSCAQTGPNSGFIVRTFADGHIEVVVGNNDWPESKSAPGVIKVGQWMNIALTSTGNSHIVYVDGVEVVSLEAKMANASNAALVVGNGYFFSDRVVNAMVKDVRVWNTIRTEKQIMDNLHTALTGSEQGLAAYFPLCVNLGSEFKDLTGNYSAKLVGSIEYIYDGALPVIVLNYTALNAAIQSAKDLLNTINEGEGEGQYPVGTKAELQNLIDEGMDAKDNAKWQKDVDKLAVNIQDAIGIIKSLNIKPNLPPANRYSAIFGGGYFYSGGNGPIIEIKNSGFTTLILWTIHIGEDGSMVFNDKAVIDQAGNYIGDAQWQHRLAKLLEAPTTIDRIELGIGAWGSKSWENIKKLIDAEGTGSNTKLYKAMKKLKEITGAVAINYDDEYTYDVASTVAFSLMLQEIGYKVSLCPYTKANYWKSVYEQVEAEKPGTIDRVYLQCYDGGAGNSPVQWNQYFGDLKVSMGLWSKHGSNCNEGYDPASVETLLKAQANNVDGGFMWIYNDIRACSASGKAQDYARAINNALK